jgi:hypothetical protein
MKTGSADTRVLQTHPTNDALRAVITDAIRDLAVTTAKIASGATAAALGRDGYNNADTPTPSLRNLTWVNGYISAAPDGKRYAASPGGHWHDYYDSYNGVTRLTSYP